MFFHNFKWKFVLIISILCIFYFIFKLLNLFYILKEEQKITKILQKKYLLVRKKQKALQEDHWNAKCCNTYID